jgi:hypothetical protein
MTREEYIEYRRTGDSINILYNFYKENWKKDRHKFFLEPEGFGTFIRLWPETNKTIHNVIGYYDVHFHVSILSNIHTGQIIQIK